MTGALRLIIETHPAWQQSGSPKLPAQDKTSLNLPATRQTLYTLLGRRGNLWHTIVPCLDLATDALSAMDSASRSQLFDRLVVAHAHGSAGQPWGHWETFVCALPVTTAQPLQRPSFAALLHRAETRHGRRHTMDQGVTLTAVQHDKNDASLQLLVLLMVALWLQATPVLLGVALLCLLEAAYQTRGFDRFIPRAQRVWLQTGRLYLYALCAGLIAIPLLAGLMLRGLDRFAP